MSEPRYVVTYRDHLDGGTYSLTVVANSEAEARKLAPRFTHPLSKIVAVERQS